MKSDRTSVQMTVLQCCKHGACDQQMLRENKEASDRPDRATSVSKRKQRQLGTYSIHISTISEDGRALDAFCDPCIIPLAPHTFTC